MVTHEFFKLEKFWDDEFKGLNYIKEKFNDPATEINWEDAGFRGPFGGWLCDMRMTQPSWNQRFIEFFERYEHWKSVSTSYYRMDPGSSLPRHVDTYKKYIEIHNLQGQEHRICRAIVFLEDRKPGHFAECQDVGYADWMAGFTLVWPWNAPHGAYNMGFEPRYTLQITGYV